MLAATKRTEVIPRIHRAGHLTLYLAIAKVWIHGAAGVDGMPEYAAFFCRHLPFAADDLPGSTALGGYRIGRICR
jgi:hypothetical protein